LGAREKRLSHFVSGQEDMFEQIRVSELKNVRILYKGDLYDLARLLLKINDARDKGTNTRSRHTIKGLAREFAMLSGLNTGEVEKVLLQYDLPFGATVEHDRDVE
jgi:hypothetical protein